MPSQNKQINMRADDETIALLKRLVPVVSAAIGLDVSQSDIVRLGLKELEKKYLSRQEPAAPVTPPPQPARKRGRPRKQS